MSLYDWLSAEEWSVSALARVLGISRQAIYQWMGDETIPSLKHKRLLNLISGGSITHYSDHQHAKDNGPVRQGHTRMEGRNQ
jgi:transcriptional regulator with XRE-family HTH domain